MPTKIRPGTTIKVPYYISKDPYSSYQNQMNLTSGEDRIDYGSGARLPNGRWPWKPCSHVTLRQATGYLGAIATKKAKYGGTWFHSMDERLYPTDNPGAPPQASFDNDALRRVLDQVDLNASDSVLLYSGVLQAIPLLGSVAKLTSVLNRAARKLAKSFRKKPFTTVVKTLISADFVDRFVISPTIDDARKFLDATNYVLRVIQTARERSAHRFALESAVKTVFNSSESSGSWSAHGDAGNINYIRRFEQSATSKAFMLLEARYDLDAMVPIKLWAQRTGLTRPLDSVWDLIPFSFVIDYFTRAGDFISALSDEMSTVDGLTGTITKIHDLWYTLDCKSEVRYKAVSLSGWSINANFDEWLVPPTLTSLEASCVSRQFIRQRIPNPWSALTSLSRNLDEYLHINLDLSQTRKRTIAELVIQAKL